MPTLNAKVRHLHALDPSVRCRFCGRGGLEFVRARNNSDLYRCVSEHPCSGPTIHRAGDRDGECWIGVDFSLKNRSLWVRCEGPSEK
jgi:hypothetical protein